MEDFIAQIKFDEKGLVPAVIQCQKTGKVLTLCYLNRVALEKTLESGKIYLYRRSKGRLMLKGETSGHIQLLKEVFMDCEGKSLLIKVEQKVAACHKGYFSCYFRRLDKDGSSRIVEERIFDPEKVY
ncbi:MAG: phosphoribosyl-AMP cyclohydrolase [Candidatus Omnitrophica bacterium]|nr:phosphoribosyl-AMP cyclohydrolase [Candidatus Omnitrophota bacterium]